MALSADRDTLVRDADREELPVAASTLIYAGAAVAKDAAGNANDAANTSGLKFRGVARARADNSAGDAGDVRVKVKKVAAARWACSGFAAGDLGADVYFSDDQTVTKSSGHCYAGKVLEVVSATVVWVDHRPAYALSEA